MAPNSAPKAPIHHAATGPATGSHVPSFSPGPTITIDAQSKFKKLLEPHVGGFDYFLGDGLKAAFLNLPKYSVNIKPSNSEIDRLTAAGEPVESHTVEYWFSNPKITKPTTKQINAKGTTEVKKLLPKHARELGCHYTGKFTADLNFVTLDSLGNPEGAVQTIPRNLGDMPIMVGSKNCYTRDKTPSQLIKMGEESNEFGGCFLVSGIERCIRLLQVPRTNHMLGIYRPTFAARGATYSPHGVSMRCKHFSHDTTAITNTLHYLTTGGSTLRFSLRKQEFLIPIVMLLKALKPTSDAEIYTRVVATDTTNTFLTDRITLLLHDFKQHSTHTPAECLAYIGARFRTIAGRGDHESDITVGRFIIDRFIQIHLETFEDKFESLILMLRKLYSFVGGTCAADNADSMQNLELLLPGHLILNIVKEKVEEGMQEMRKGIQKEARTRYDSVVGSYRSAKFWAKTADKYGGGAGGTIGKKISAFLATGNVVSSTGLDLMQVSGYTIVAERLNFLRYISHYRSVHRGQFFMTMKTTTVRKLLPDSWGFLCPVHTPDGGPCGLLNHMATLCETQCEPLANTEGIEATLINLGVVPSGAGGSGRDGNEVLPHTYLPVCLDGKVIGGCSVKEAKRIAAELRIMKVNEQITKTLEVAFFPPMPGGSGPFPGLFLATGMARTIRPVRHIASGKVEFIGPQEQPFMDIACLPEDVQSHTTHQEIDATNMLSLIASMTPFSDYNQSPRNMYQCQMGKQTMGTPAHSMPHRTDNKMYKIQNPQAPIVQTQRHGDYNMDDYPNGCNAVVAVLSYTGFDMEDAMILNKSSYERGFGHASVYKTKVIDLKEEAKMHGGVAEYRFSNKRPPTEKAKKGGRKGEEGEEASDAIDGSVGPDGLPTVGQWVNEGEALYTYVDDVNGKSAVGKYKDMEKCCIQNVRLLGAEPGTEKNAKLQRLSVTMRIPRNPVIGDKFSSRHGQKGVMSILWPQVDMPFSESGISPDIIINPHAFPSRMTIGMLIESMAGKSGALHGKFQDATPFQFHESGEKLAVDHFGEQLQEAGYSYYGSEALYSGVSGEVMKADLYIGIVMYQRLRHMVSDKYQVRSTGKVNDLTRQPIKGRKKGGGIRLGEMERDALLSHGTAFLLHDRLMNCSDRHVGYCCGRCGGVLSPQTRREEILSAGKTNDDMQLVMTCVDEGCRGLPESVEPVALPYVFKYLSWELAGMGISMKCELK